MEEFEHIFEAYFTNSMRDDEKDAFEKRLEQDAVFKADYDFFIGVKQASHELAKEHIRVLIEHNDQGADTKKGTKNIRRLFPIIISIAALFLIAIVAYPIFLEEDFNPNSFYQENFEAYSPSLNRGGDDLKPFIPLYESKNYEGFLDATKELSSNAEIKMLRAMSHWQMRDLNSAKLTLLSISDETAFRDRKYWYLGLLSIKNKENQEAILYFETLKKISQYKSEEVQAILSYLQ